MVSVKLDELIEAFDFVSFGGPEEHAAYISLETGRIYWESESVDEELPDDLGDAGRYLTVPNKYDLALGKALVLRFVAAELPNDYAKVDGFFRQREAYARLKDLLGAAGRLDAWYAFEAAETEEALRNWCRDNGIQIVDGQDNASG
jgi:hypothetical protein